MEELDFLPSCLSAHNTRFHQCRVQSWRKRRRLVMRKILLTLSGTHGSGKSTNAGKCYYLLNRSGYKFSYIRHQDLLDPFGFIVRRTARILHLEPNRLEKMKPTRVAWSLYLLFIY